MDALDAIALAQNGDFRNRLRIAIIKRSLPLAVGSDERQAELAKRCLMSPERNAAIMAESVALDPAVAAAGFSATDEQIETALADVWDAYTIPIPVTVIE